MKYGNSTNINGVKEADSSLLALPCQSVSLYNDKRNLYRFFLTNIMQELVKCF